ncbi:MAG: hypothetical protein PF489_14950 [Salinivirgaceae bacterium]|jgi:hypothetical protein|nr:hypothetical protein [Salinivirgaceae bacterium]
MKKNTKLLLITVLLIITLLPNGSGQSQRYNHLVSDIESKKNNLQKRHNPDKASHLRQSGYVYNNIAKASGNELEDPFHHVSSPLISGYYRDIAVKNNTAYVVNNWGLMIFDVTDKQNPELVNSIISHYSTGFVDVHDQYLIVSGPAIVTEPQEDFGTTIYDISSPHEPEFITHLQVPTQASKIIENTLHLRTRGNLYIYDIAQIESPVLLDSLDSVYSCEWDDDYMYTIYTDNDSTCVLKTFDNSNPDNPTEINDIEITGDYTLSYLLADNYHLYLGGEYELTIIDIENAGSPEILINQQFDNMTAGNYYPQFAIHNDHLFFRGGLILDISESSNPQEAGNYYPDNVYNYVRNIHVEGDFLFAANWEQGFYIADISQPAQPDLQNWHVNFDLYYGVTVHNNYAYVTSMNGLTILDVSDPIYPVSLGLNSDMWWCRAAIVEGNYAYVASDSDVGIYNVSDPEDPQLISRYEGGGKHLVQNGQYLFLTNNSVDAIFVYKIIAANSLEMIGGYYNLMQSPNDLCVKGNYLFVADGNLGNYYNNGGLHVFDISNPYDIEEVFISNPDTTRYYRSLALKDDYLFMGSNEPGLYIYDVSNPASPELLSYFENDLCESRYNCIDMEILGDSLVVAGVQEKYIVDISNIDSLKTVARTFSGRWTSPWTITIVDGLLYEASILSLDIYSIGDTTWNGIPITNNNSTKFSIKATPNPFSVSTRICYTIPDHLAYKKGAIHIYSLEGRLIKTLFENKAQHSGNNVATWNGVDNNNKTVSPGMYIIVVQIGTISDFHKTLFIH